jgi:hypothetical protein
MSKGPGVGVLLAVLKLKISHQRLHQLTSNKLPKIEIKNLTLTISMSFGES